MSEKKKTTKPNTSKNENDASTIKFQELSDDELDIVTGGSALEPRIVEVD